MAGTTPARPRSFLGALMSRAKKINVTVPDVLVREQPKRWMSCDTREGLRVNWRIIQAPMRLVDYVAAQELAHLRHAGHGRAFWSLLGRIMPNYEERREDLRMIGVRLVWS